MQHKGIRYDVKIGIGQDQWVWTAHTPNPKQGKVNGPRIKAVTAAKRAIQQWCYQHPARCDTAAVGLTAESPA